MITNPEPTKSEVHVISSKPLMCKTGMHGIIEYANEYFVELSGYSEGEIIGESLELIAHPDTPKIISSLIWENISNKKRTNAIVKYISKSGNFYWLQIKLDYKVDEVSRAISNIYLYATSPDRASILKIEKIYTKLNKIENEAGYDVAQNYFKGYLENLSLTYETFIEKYLKR